MKLKTKTEKLSARLVNVIITNYVENDKLLVSDAKLRFIPGPNQKTEKKAETEVIFATIETPGRHFEVNTLCKAVGAMLQLKFI